MTTMTKPEFKAPSDLLETHASAAAVAALVVTPTPLSGTWLNADPATRGLVKVVITTSGTAMSVDAFGACSPTPCNWGVVAGTAYAASVSTTAAVAFTAQYNFSFKRTTVTGHLEGKYLIVETYDTFIDNSGRSNYYSRYQMHK